MQALPTRIQIESRTFSWAPKNHQWWYAGFRVRWIGYPSSWAGNQLPFLLISFYVTSTFATLNTHIVEAIASANCNIIGTLSGYTFLIWWIMIFIFLLWSGKSIINLSSSMQLFAIWHLLIFSCTQSFWVDNNLFYPFQFFLLNFCLID